MNRRGQDGGDSVGSCAGWAGCCAIPALATEKTSWWELCWRLNTEGSSCPWDRQLISNAGEFFFRQRRCLFREAHGVDLLLFRGVAVQSSLRFLSAWECRATAGHGRFRREVPNRLGPSAGHNGASNQEDTAKQTAHTETVDTLPKP